MIHAIEYSQLAFWYNGRSKIFVRIVDSVIHRAVLPIDDVQSSQHSNFTVAVKPTGALLHPTQRKVGSPLVWQHNADCRTLNSSTF